MRDDLVAIWTMGFTLFACGTIVAVPNLVHAHQELDRADTDLAIARKHIGDDTFYQHEDRANDDITRANEANARATPGIILLAAGALVLQVGAAIVRRRARNATRGRAA